MPCARNRRAHGAPLFGCAGATFRIFERRRALFPDVANPRKPPQNKDFWKARSDFVTTAVYHFAGRTGLKFQVISRLCGRRREKSERVQRAFWQCTARGACCMLGNLDSRLGFLSSCANIAPHDWMSSPCLRSLILARCS